MSEIEDVSDTARWVAVYRGKEGQRIDALFQDPWALRLAGERGESIAKRMPNTRFVEWALVIRTVAIDRLIEDAIAKGIDAVVNLGAGLDTRPYRMKLPRSLHWVEVDFPKMIDYKTEILKREAPVCNLQRIPLDLTKDDLRATLLADLGLRFKKVLVLTEGVIFYLSNAQAAGLARDLAAQKTFVYWVQDFRGDGLQNVGWGRALKKAPLQFDVTDWFGFFKEYGWRLVEKIYAIDEGQRLGRPLPKSGVWAFIGNFLPQTLRKRIKESYGCALLIRSDLLVQ